LKPKADRCVDDDQAKKKRLELGRDRVVRYTWGAPCEGVEMEEVREVSHPRIAIGSQAEGGKGPAG